jgi:hypothetical protein
MEAVRHAIALALLLLSSSPQASTRKAIPTKDFDTPLFEAAKATLQDKSAEAAARTAAMRELVTHNAVAARELLAGALSDTNPLLQRRAAEWLAKLKDPRGLQWQLDCLDQSPCRNSHPDAARLLGNTRDPQYAPKVRAHVQRILQSGLLAGRWEGSATDRGVLQYGAIALARMGLPDDKELVLRVVSAQPDEDFLEPLGYIDDARSRTLLWSAYQRQLRTPTCSGAGLGVPALLPLSRLGEDRAVQALKDILRGIGTPPDLWPQGSPPSLCADRAQAFRGLRPRDAERFAETVFEIAGKEPEGPGTFEAWHALGFMRPQGFGQRVLKLAVSRQHWRLVSRQMLNKVVLATDPDLADEFWQAYDDVQVASEQTGVRMQVKAGLAYLLFSGSGQWTGD